MIMPITFLDIELDFNFGPEAFDVPLFVPRADLKSDAPRRPLSILELGHNFSE